jgi:uncharacterized protein (DUF983 family)
VRRLRAIVASRCPRCLSGAVWRRTFTINVSCPVCGLLFEREPGYWTGAMVASYALGVPLLALLVVGIWALTRWDLAVALLIANLAFLVVAPIVWRYSRVVWLHLDWMLDPVRSA